MSELSSEAKALIRRVGLSDGPRSTDRARVKRRIVATLAGAGTALGGGRYDCVGRSGGGARCGGREQGDGELGRSVARRRCRFRVRGLGSRGRFGLPPRRGVASSRAHQRSGELSPKLAERPNESLRRSLRTRSRTRSRGCLADSSRHARTARSVAVASRRRDGARRRGARGSSAGRASGRACPRCGAIDEARRVSPKRQDSCMRPSASSRERTRAQRSPCSTSMRRAFHRGRSPKSAARRACSRSAISVVRAMRGGRRRRSFGRPPNRRSFRACAPRVRFRTGALRRSKMKRAL